MPNKKVIEGFGASEKVKGGLVHCVTTGNVALCDKRFTGLKINKSLLPSGVTCKACRNYKGWKDLVGQQLDTQKEAKTKAKKKPAPKKKAAPKKEIAKKKAAPKKKAPAKKAPAKKVVKKEPVDFVQVLGPKRNGVSTVKVKHIPSKKILFEGIHLSVGDKVINLLNNMNLRWEKGKPIPDNFIAQCRKKVRRAYKVSKVKLPDTFKVTITRRVKRRSELKKAERRTIKRRKTDKVTTKKKGRVIKRRSNAKDNDNGLFGRRDGTPAATVIKMLQKGSTGVAIIKKLVNKHDLKEKRARAKLNAVIRRTTRVDGQRIVHIITKKPELDRYKFDES